MPVRHRQKLQCAEVDRQIGSVSPGHRGQDGGEPFGQGQPRQRCGELGWLARGGEPPQRGVTLALQGLSSLTTATSKAAADRG